MYVDTSVWVALVTREATTVAVRGFVAEVPDLTYSAWCGTEVASALARKVRVGALDPASAVRAHRDYVDATQLLARELPTTRAAMELAASYCLESPDSGLCAGDALHLAIAALAGERELATSDVRLARAAEEHGRRVTLVQA